FGEQIRVLHPFHEPFTSDAGASVIRQFTFVQNKTDVVQLLQTSLSLFSEARRTTWTGPSSSAKLWQLQLIISDGVCENHAFLRTLVRAAYENQIMIVFVVINNKPEERDSIFNIQHVRYITNPADGRMTLKMNKYLDTFPFEYYVVLRDVQA